MQNVKEKAFCELCEENKNNKYSCVGESTGSIMSFRF
jgi:hypothetical protein